MDSNRDLLWIKNKYGEDMMHLCRRNFARILEVEGFLPKILQKYFMKHRNLAEDIINQCKEDDFKQFIFSKVDVKQDKIEHNLDKSAKELFEQGYNCAQSVFCTHCEKVGIDFETGLKLSSSFGGGMGRLREVCGTVSSMFAIAGLKYGYTSNNNDEAKAKHYELIQSLAKKFKEENGSIICRELLGLDEGADSPIPSKRTEEYYKKRPCAELCGIAAEIFQTWLDNQ